jgi:hypothetical protein
VASSLTHLLKLLFYTGFCFNQFEQDKATTTL